MADEHRPRQLRRPPQDPRLPAAARHRLPRRPQRQSLQDRRLPDGGEPGRRRRRHPLPGARRRAVRAALPPVLGLRRLARRRLQQAHRADRHQELRDRRHARGLRGARLRQSRSHAGRHLPHRPAGHLLQPRPLRHPAGAAAGEGALPRQRPRRALHLPRHHHRHRGGLHALRPLAGPHPAGRPRAPRRRRPRHGQQLRHRPRAGAGDAQEVRPIPLERGLHRPQASRRRPRAEAHRPRHHLLLVPGRAAAAGRHPLRQAGPRPRRCPRRPAASRDRRRHRHRQRRRRPPLRRQGGARPGALRLDRHRRQRAAAGLVAALLRPRHRLARPARLLRRPLRGAAQRQPAAARARRRARPPPRHHQLPQHARRRPGLRRALVLQRPAEAAGRRDGAGDRPHHLRRHRLRALPALRLRHPLHALAPHLLDLPHPRRRRREPAPPRPGAAGLQSRLLRRRLAGRRLHAALHPFHHVPRLLRDARPPLDPQADARDPHRREPQADQGRPPARRARS